jgi:hypothetical protein
MEQQINLYQPILGAEKRLFSARAIVVAISLFACCLVAISAYATYRVRGAEHAVATIESQSSARAAAMERGLAALHPGADQQSVELQARQLAADISEREHALALVRRGMVDAAGSFSARLEALARRHLDGLWLSRVFLSAGERQLALVGQTSDPQLVPQYLAALATERALDHTRFDRFSMRRDTSGATSSPTTFEVGVAPPLAADEEAQP